MNTCEIGFSLDFHALLMYIFTGRMENCRRATGEKITDVKKCWKFKYMSEWM
jgi:hypothetical protein